MNTYIENKLREPANASFLKIETKKESDHNIGETSKRETNRQSIESRSGNWARRVERRNLARLLEVDRDSRKNWRLKTKKNLEAAIHFLFVKGWNFIMRRFQKSPLTFINIVMTYMHLSPHMFSNDAYYSDCENMYTLNGDFYDHFFIIT